MREKVKQLQPQWIAVIAAGVCGLLTHLFGLVNVLHNCDDIAQQPGGYGAGVTSGRWLLSLMGDFADFWGLDYNLVTINGLLFLALLACSAGLLVGALRIGSRPMAALVGMLFVAFPTVFASLTFRYCSVHYGIGVLLAVCAVWVFPKPRVGPALSALSIALSLGIYQAYIPITITAFVLMLLRQALEGDADFRHLILRGLSYCGVLVLGLLLYYFFLNIALELYGTRLSDYQGVNEMGAVSLRALPSLLREAVYSVCMLPLKDYCGVSATRLVKLFYLLLAGISALLLFALLLRKKRPLLVTCLILFLCALVPVCVNFIVIMCPQGWVYTMMVYAFVMLAWVPVIMWECLPVQTEGQKRLRSIAGKALGVVLAGLIFGYSYQTNVNYTALYYANRQVENYLNSLVTQIRMTEGFHTDLEWAFVGDIDDPLMNCYWQHEINIGGIEFTQWLLKRYSVCNWIQNYCGYDPPLADKERVLELSENSAVQAMPCWPNDGSIRIVDDTLVVKFDPDPSDDMD